MTSELMTGKREKGKYKDPEATISLAVFERMARTSVWLKNELKTEGKKINQEVGWGQLMLNLLGYFKFGLFQVGQAALEGFQRKGGEMT